MKRALILMLAVFVLTMAGGNAAFATNGIEFIGFGAYGKSMGGAVTAAPFDTTTSMTNPAGYTEIGTRADFYGEMFMPDRELNFTNAGGAKTSGGSKIYMNPAIGWIAPISEGSKVHFGGSISSVSGMGVDYDAINTTYLQANPSAGIMGPLMNGKVFSLYFFYKMSPTLAVKVNDKLSLAGSLNIDYQTMQFKQWFKNTDTANYPTSAGYLEDMGVDLSTGAGAFGFGFALGALYDLNDMITLGASYTSKQWFQNMEYRLQQGDVIYSPDSMTLYTNQDGTYGWSGMDFPQQLALGIAIKPTKRLLIDFDYKWINYNDSFDKQYLEGDFITTNMATGQSGTSNALPFNFGWKNVHVFAVGLQYVLMEDFFVRTGFNHGNSPIGEEDVDNSWAFPAIVEDHLSLGATKGFGKNWQVHGSYMHAFENTLTGKSGTEISLKEDSLIFGLSYKFN
ncbi:aromatic hydrocarbon degradation membrane protein [Candidatus Magnetoovum chiemensis]|nr:aromatic hydrocarbon degradation membrane protein [Candidatus Magnetoovum chiemensis]